MTINTESTKRTYSGNGVATAFDYDFKIFVESDLRVSLVDDVTGLETLQVLNVDYTITGEGFEAGGKATFVTPPPTGNTVILLSNVPYTQLTDYKNQGRFFPETVENNLDRATRQILQLDERSDRSLLLPVQVVGVSTQLPVPEAGKIIGWALDGLSLVNYTNGGGGGGGGEVNTASNLGSGQGQVYASKVAADLRFRSLRQGTNVTITQTATEITINAAGGGGGSWGTITGTLSAQTDLQAALDANAAFTQAGTGATTRTMLAKARERVSIADFISAADLNTAVTRAAEVELSTPFANALAQLTAIGGGELYIPAGSWKTTATLIVNEPSIDVIGAGGDGNHDAASPATGTTIRWRGADGGEIMRVQSKGLVGSPTISGGSVRNLKLSGGNVNTASIGILVASARGWVFENITIYDITSRAVYITVQALGAEARDTQKCLFRHVTVRLLSAVSAAAVGFELGGDAGANASFNIFEHCDVLHQDGAGYKLVTADNNMFTQCRSFRPLGTGYGVEVHGNNTAGFECNSNTFYGLSPSTGGVKLFGTTTYVVPSKNTVFYTFDIANGSSMPVVETGATWHMHKSTGATYQDYLVKPVIGVDDSAVDAHRAARGTESMRIYNFSANHTRYVDGLANEWGIRIDGSGNFEVLRLGGTGLFKVANDFSVAGASTFTGAATFTAGATFSTLTATTTVTAGTDLVVAAGNRLRLNGGANGHGIRWSSPNVELLAGASFAAGFGTNTVGFNGTTPVAKPTVTGSRGGNAALASLLTALDSMGLITNSSTA